VSVCETMSVSVCETFHSHRVPKNKNIHIEKVII
jgi:hypothetical protein